MRYRFVIVGLLAALLAVLLPISGPSGPIASAYAQTVSRIIVEGNQRVENDTVLSYMQIQPGQPFDAAKVDESVKALFQTGLFSDVQIFQRGAELVVKVEENPMIDKVNFEGNVEVKDSDLAKETQLKERMMFQRGKVVDDVNRIIALYRRSGYYAVSVSPKIIRLPQNRVDLVFEINEGAATTVSEIHFVGNNSFAESDLKAVIGTSEHRWWKFFARNDNYDADRSEYDKELLRRYYLKNGFADVKVDSADAQLTPDGQHFVLTYTIEEGPRYKIADVAVNVGNTNLDTGPMKNGVTTGVGDDYDASKVDKTVENLTLEASRQGFVFAKVDPQIDRNEANRTLNVTYNVVEGPRTYIERIDIVGNQRTEDQVIRREMQLFEGDAYNRVLIERARRRLTALDFFDKIDLREDPGSAPDKVVLVVTVHEKSTGSISFSAGYSTVQTIVGAISLEERNFLGKGLDVKIDTQVSFTQQQIDFGYTDPYFLGLPISAGFDLFANSIDNTAYSSYMVKQFGGDVRTGFALDENNSIQLKYGAMWQKIDGVDTSVASPEVIASQGTFIDSYVDTTYTFDNLDNPVLPTSGFRGQIEAAVHGLGGDVDFGSIEAHGWYFMPLYEDQVILKLEGNAGYMHGFGRDIPLQDRFFKGSDTFRGFAVSGVGPHQVNNAGGSDSIGANTYAIGTVEVNFPLGLPQEWGIQGALFSDFGTVFGTDATSLAFGQGTCTGSTDRNGNWISQKDCKVSNSHQLRASVGAGIVWQSPFGPLRFDLAYPVLKAPEDETEWFRFSVGTRF